MQFFHSHKKVEIYIYSYDLRDIVVAADGLSALNTETSVGNVMKSSDLRVCKLSLSE